MGGGSHVYRVGRMRTASAALGFVVLAAFQTAMIYVFGAAALWRWIYIVLGLTGTAGLFLLAKLLDKHQIGGGIAWVGRASLAVFFLNAFSPGATREGLLRVVYTPGFLLQVLLPAVVAPLLPGIVLHQAD